MITIQVIANDSKGNGNLNADRYQKDLDSLLANGKMLHIAIQCECFPEKYERAATRSKVEKAEEYLKSLPSFRGDYQSWYSEAKSLVRQLLPDRLTDFTRYYEKPKSRKEVTNENYRIEDYLQGLSVTQGDTTLVGPEAAIPQFYQQLNLVKSIGDRFRSSFFDIRQLAQADLFDSELDVAGELANNGFNRAAGAVAGVVLERHLKEVCENHGLKLRKKAPQISDLNDRLKSEKVIAIPEWRSIQHLGDLRNLCAHDKDSEPTRDQVEDLIAGVAKITKTIF